MRYFGVRGKKMKSFYAHLPSGKIVMSGTCQDDDLALQQFAGALIVEGQANQDQHYINATGYVEIIPAAPQIHHTFNYTTKQWQPDADAAWGAVRLRRNQLMADTDWRITKAQETGLMLAPAWIVYRQALRDITNQADPWSIVWPTAPT